ncbi:hypothetical protein [Streptomyces flavofungini]|uniref:hypothetical protein n=1 Tax=Streptomyces flavofungini TaxID=68200 RepID=UPI0034DF9E45
MTVVQGILAAIVAAVVGVPFAAVLTLWGEGDPKDTKRVTLEKNSADPHGGGPDEITPLACCNLLVVLAAIVVLELAMADVVADSISALAIAALCALMAAAVPGVRYAGGTRGLPLALHVAGAVALAAGCLSAGAFAAGPGAHRSGLTLLAVTAVAAAATAVLALLRARVTLTVLPVAAAVLLAVFGAVASSVHGSAGYAMRYGHPVSMALPSSCVQGRGMGCVFTWDRSAHGRSAAFSDGQQVTVHFSEEGRSRYGRYYALGGLYEPGDDNDPTGVTLETRAVEGDAYVTLGYAADSWTPLGRFRPPGAAWAALPLLLLPLGLHLFRVRDREAQPLRRRSRADVTRSGTR